MDWFKFSNHGESNNHAFEVMCNLLFENWCNEEYKGRIAQNKLRLIDDHAVQMVLEGEFL